MRATTGTQISETLRSRECTGSAICQVSNESYQQPFPYVNIPVIIEGEKTGRTFRRLHYVSCLFSQWREHRVCSLVSKREHFLFAPYHTASYFSLLSFFFFSHGVGHDEGEAFYSSICLSPTSSHQTVFVP